MDKDRVGGLALLALFLIPLGVAAKIVALWPAATNALQFCGLIGAVVLITLLLCLKKDRQP